MLLRITIRYRDTIHIIVLDRSLLARARKGFAESLLVAQYVTVNLRVGAFGLDSPHGLGNSIGGRAVVQPVASHVADPIPGTRISIGEISSGYTYPASPQAIHVTEV